MKRHALIHKRVTVDRPVIGNPKCACPHWHFAEDLIDFVMGFRKSPLKILMGGPMMGIARYSGYPVIRIPMPFWHSIKRICQRNRPPGRCVDACPMHLIPSDLNRLVMAGKYDDLGAYHILDCIECGSCSYVCPAKRYLVQSIRIGKDAVRKNAKKA